LEQSILFEKPKEGNLLHARLAAPRESPNKQIEELVGVFTDPIIVWPGPWQDTMPEWIKAAITTERLIESMKALKGEKPTGTNAEVLAYMYPRSLEAPLDSDWTHIYLYVSTRVMSIHKETEVPADIMVDSLSDYQMQRLKELKDWIYKERIRLRQERQRAQRAQGMAETKAKAPKQLKLGV
jgi:hypothetical protein